MFFNKEKREQARRTSLMLSSSNLLTKDQLKAEYLCGLCQAILVEPVECRSCKSRFHHKCLEKFHNETGECPMQCPNPRFLCIKKEVEKKLQKMQFKCRNHLMGCNEVLSYTEVAEHDSKCSYQPVKCQAYNHCKTKCVRAEIERHEAVCPYISVPCIYCRMMVQRMNIIQHEQVECKGTHNCLKCGMTVQKSETQRTSHNCFTSLAGYLTNMLESKDYIIDMFKEEIQRKNQLISELLERQEMLEQKLSKIEAVLMFEDDDFEQVTGVKKQDDIEGEDAGPKTGALDTGPSPNQGSTAITSSLEKTDEEDIKGAETAEEKFQRQVTGVAEDWRDTFKDAQFYVEELRQQIFEPASEWSNWQETRDYSIKTRISDRSLLCILSTATVEASLEELAVILSDHATKPDWDPNYQEGRLVMQIGDSVDLHYLRTKKIALVSSRDQYLVYVEKWLSAAESPSGRRTLAIAAKSAPPRGDHPPAEGCVRAATMITGWWIEELEPPQKGCLARFMIESDFKISLFVQKQVAPRASNYAARLKDYVETLNSKQKGSATKNLEDE